MPRSISIHKPQYPVLADPVCEAKPTQSGIMINGYDIAGQFKKILVFKLFLLITKFKISRTPELYGNTFIMTQ